VIPKPALIEPSGQAFGLTSDTHIVVRRGSAEAASVGNYLAELVRGSTSYSLPVTSAGCSGRHPEISLDLDRSHRPDESYRLQVSRPNVSLEAGTGAGLYRGVQTLRQLLPAKVESASA
jgi:hexosaminidase